MKPSFRSVFLVLARLMDSLQSLKESLRGGRRSHRRCSCPSRYGPLAAQASWSTIIPTGAADIDVLKQVGAERELGLEPQFLPQVVHTDGHLAGGETLVADAARHHWGLFDAGDPSATNVVHRHAA